MGWGDEILASGEARHAQKQDPQHRRVQILDRNDRPRWHVLWERNPRIARPEERGDFIRIYHAAFHRPYIDWDRMRREFAEIHPGRKFRTKNIRDRRLPWRFTGAKCRRGELPGITRLPKGDYVVVEPHHKSIQVNRDWGWAKWQAVVDALPEIDWVQINPRKTPILKGVRHIPAATFPEACTLLSGARAYVGLEGGLYHAASALGLKGVGLFGGYISPANQGYDDFVNLYEPMGGESPCGQRVACPHCQEAMRRISPERMIEGIRSIL